MLAQHMSKSVEHYTPKNIVEAARFLMGGIDLDPASCLVANKTVKAKQIFDVADDGLSKHWYGKVFLNPPGGKYRVVIETADEGHKLSWVPIKDGPGESSMRVWWQTLVDEYENGRVEQAFFVAFTLEILRSSQKGTPVQKFFRCYPRDRIKFGGAASPTHANVLIYLPDKKMIPRNGFDPFQRFKRIFSEIGYCEPGSNA